MNPSLIRCLRAFHILVYAYLLFCCYCYNHYKNTKNITFVVFTLIPLSPLSYYFATKHFAADTKLSRCGWIDNSAANTWEYSLAPLVSNQKIWVEYSTLESCCDPLYLWVIKTNFWCRCRGAQLYSLSHLGFIFAGHYEELERRENKNLSLNYEGR